MSRLRPPISIEELRGQILRLEGEVAELGRTLSEERAARQVGQPAAAAAPAGDATAVGEAHSALQASAELYRTIVTTADEGIFTSDADGRSTFANERMASMIGYTVEEIVGHTSDYFLHPSAWGDGREGFERRKLGARDRRDLPLRRKDGSTLWASVASSPLLDEEGRFVGSFGMVTDVTEQRRLEDVRRRTEERFSLVFRASPIPIGVSTIDGEILDVNARFAEFFGYSVEELVGHNAHELGLWADPDGRESLLDVVRRDGRARDREVAFRRKSGEVRDVLLSVEAIELGDADEPVRIFMFTDVTERNHAERELRESRSLLEQAQAVGHIGSWVSDSAVDGGLWWSEETKRIFGLPGDEFDGRLETFFSLVHPDDLASVKAASEAALRDRQPYVIRHRIVRPDGTVRLLHEEAQIVRDETGKPTKMVGVVQDVTESSAAEGALRHNEERYRALFDESPMPMLAFAPDETMSIVMANQAAAELYGYTTNELQKMRLPDIRAPEDAELVREVVRAVPPGRYSAGTIRHKRKDDTFLQVDVTINDVRLEGRPLKLAVLLDVTQRRDLEDQLRQSQKMEAVGRLAGGVAHDFNNLLTAILGYADLLSERFRVGGPERAEIQEIRRAAERAASLTRQLLAFSRKQVLVPEALDLGSVVRGLSALLERLIGENITVTVTASTDLGRVLADPGQMEQVVMNLALNARDAMPGGGELLFDLRNADFDEADSRQHLGMAPGAYVRLAVTDTGLGMSPDVLKQIFEPFFTTKPVGAGTGLGLATVHGIVNQSGGSIWVESEPGRGTTFTIFLPRTAAPLAMPHPVSDSGPLYGSGTILLVEDEDQLRTLAKRILELRRYTVLDARNAEQALEISRQLPGEIDLLLTDVVMPGMSGPDLAATILSERPGTRVLYMSGYTDEAIVRDGALNAGTQFIGKPFTPSRLAERVGESMARACETAT